MMNLFKHHVSRFCTVHVLLVCEQYVYTECVHNVCTVYVHTWGPNKRLTPRPICRFSTPPSPPSIINVL